MKPSYLSRKDFNYRLIFILLIFVFCCSVLSLSLLYQGLEAFFVKEQANKIIRPIILKYFLVISIFFIIFVFIALYYTRKYLNIFSKVLELGDRLKFLQTSQNEESLEEILDQAQVVIGEQFHQLKFETEKRETILQSISDSIVALDTENQILFYNKRMSKIFSYEDVQNLSFLNELGDEVQQAFHKSMNKGKEFKFLNFKIQTKFFDLRINPIKSQHGAILGVTLAFRDVTAKRNADQLRVDFVANVSHELKTPLTSIKGYAQLLDNNNELGEEKTNKYLHKIIDNSQKLISLFEDLLKLSQIENHQDFIYQDTQLEPIINSIYDTLSEKFSQKKIYLSKSLELDTININPQLFELALYNLLENAVKYSYDDVNIKVSSFLDHKKQTIIQIEDNGIGIESEKQSRIFERFYRTNESRSYKIEGSGIGLSLVKHIIHKHNGKISVKSSKNGTAFTIELKNLQNKS